jgi:catechol 2,3-dioxygenase-like lactoylglutathione lyase family enzyme
MTDRPAALEVLGLDNVLLAVGDFDAALDFYAGSLGLPVKFQIPNLGVACFRLGPEEPGLLVRAGAVHAQPARETPRVWVEVADARAAGAALRELGVAPLDDPFEVATGWTVEVADPWGNVIGLTDYTKDRSRGRQAPQRASGPAQSG